MREREEDRTSAIEKAKSQSISQFQQSQGFPPPSLIVETPTQSPRHKLVGWVGEDGGKVEEERGGEGRGGKGMEEADGSVCVDCTVG